MIYCSECGTELEDHSKFCHACGTPRVKRDDFSRNEGGDRSGDVGEEGFSDSYKTEVRGKPIYGVVNLENLPEGHVVDDRYEVGEKLGQGGFGAVYRAYDRKMEIDKALKVLPEAVVNDQKAMQSLRKEATTMVRLNHPNIVRVFDFQEKGSIKYIDMEFVTGKSLNDVNPDAPEERLSEEEVKKYARQIVSGLAYAHENRVIHRDIKPQNILISKKSEVKITDFGISERLRNSKSRMSNTGAAGTLAYMSPEQLQGENVGRESDIYSFGALLYELLSGNPPFHKGAIEYQIINKEPVEIEGVSQEINSLLQRCLAKDYRERYRNFEEVLALLNGNGKRLVDEREEPLEEKPEENKEEKSKGAQTEKKAIFGFVAVVLVAAVLFMFLVPKRGRLYVTAEPSHAKIEIAGTDIVFDQGMELKAGEYIITATAEGYGKQETAITIKAGEETITAMTLVLLTGKLSVNTDPAGALVNIDDTKGNISVYSRGMALEPGRYQVVVTADGYISRQEWVTVRGGEEKTVGVNLLPKPGRLYVLTEPSHADIRLLDRKESYSRGMDLTSGTYRIEIKAPGYRDKVVRVAVTAGEEERVNVRLVQKPGKLYVTTEPSGVSVKILNIKEKYRQGMELEAGRYHLEVSKRGFVAKREWVPLDAGNEKTVDVKLKRKEKTTNSLGMDFVYIKPGTFIMGSPSDEPSRWIDEKQHQVTLTRGYYMQTTEVTQGQWKAVMGNNPSYFKNCGDDCPVEKVSWNDVQAFIGKLNRREGGTVYRLPTEAEWEYACRAGSKTALYTGEITIQGGRNAPELDRIAWYGGNSCVNYSGGYDCSGWSQKQYSCSNCGSHPTGRKEPNEWGLYDMIGNVWEWCQDWRGDYPSGHVSDPVGPSEGMYRVTRGGSWGYAALYCRSAERNTETPGKRGGHLGFRLAKTP